MGIFGETITEPRGLFLHKLGAALTMEKKILDMLPQLEEEAHDETLRASLRQHYAQTERHVANLQRAFDLVGAEVDDSSCPAIEGLEKEGQANLKMVDDSLNDAVIVSAVAETEHHEIAVYEGLITQATAMGQPSLVALFEENLEQERATLTTAQGLARQLAQQTAPVA